MNLPALFLAHAEMEAGSVRGWDAFVHGIGLLHPVVVHFPIALLLTAALLEAIHVWEKNAAWLAPATGFVLLLGTLGALVAAALGWADATAVGVEVDLKPILFWHRWLGTATAFLGLAASFLWLMQRSSPLAARRWIYRSVLWLAALLVVVAGHLGGTLVYGLDYYPWSK